MPKFTNGDAGNTGNEEAKAKAKGEASNQAKAEDLAKQLFTDTAAIGEGEAEKRASSKVVSLESARAKRGLTGGNAPSQEGENNSARTRKTAPSRDRGEASENEALAEGEEAAPVEWQRLRPPEEEPADPIVAQIPSESTPVMRMRRSYDVQLPTGFVRAFVAGLTLVFLTWALVAVPVMVVYRLNRTNPWLVPFTNADAVVFGTRLWGWSLGDPLRLEGAVYTLWPLGLTFLWLLIFRWGLHFICRGLPGGVFFSVPGAAVAALIVFSSSSGAVSLWWMLGTLSVLMLVAAAWEWWASRRKKFFAKGFDSAHTLDPVPAKPPRFADKVPAWLGTFPASLRSLGLVLTLLGGFWVLLSWQAHRTDVSAISKLLGDDATGSVMVPLLELAFLPNAIIYALAWGSGAGFQFGTDTVFSPFKVSSGPIPSLPILGLLPKHAVGAGPVVLTVFAGILAGVWWYYRTSRPVFRNHFRLALVSTVAFVAVLAGLLFLSRGSLGASRLAVIGPDLSHSLGLISVSFFVPALVVYLVVHPEVRRPILAGLGLGVYRLKETTAQSVKAKSKSLGNAADKPSPRRKSPIIDEPVAGADQTRTDAIDLAEPEAATKPVDAAEASEKTKAESKAQSQDESK